MRTLVDHNNGQTYIFKDGSADEQFAAAQAKANDNAKHHRAMGYEPHYTIFDENDNPVYKVYQGEEIEAKPAPANKDILDLQAAYSSLQATVDAMGAEVARQNDRIASLEGAIGSPLEGRVAQAESNVVSLDTAMAEQNERIGALENSKKGK